MLRAWGEESTSLDSETWVRILSPPLTSYGTYPLWVSGTSSLKQGDVVSTYLGQDSLQWWLRRSSHGASHTQHSLTSITEYVVHARHCSKVLWIPCNERYQKICSCKVYIGEIVNKINKIGA